jgi:hypothetical protein
MRTALHTATTQRDLRFFIRCPFILTDALFLFAFPVCLFSSAASLKAQVQSTDPRVVGSLKLNRFSGREIDA